ncbi:hypothetical protein BaRGS_00003206 [Batillaria attramentaria]|uniref:3-oxo-5alpha-steroid 4-dehydrogenase (NADP(+)) n=1 Tax=Batillaria attramentaria TaxID=370345 RepID=A0ABD0M1T1_9CAEN
MAIADDTLSFVRSSLQNEEKFMVSVCYILLFWAVCLVFILLSVSAPYGRYSRPGYGFQVPAKLAWFVQELPSFLVPVYLLLFTDCPRAGELKNLVAVGLFLLHYFHRTFIFPFLIKGGKPTPLVPFVMAFIFCLLNGYLQGGYLLRYADLEKNVSTVQFFAGACQGQGQGQTLKFPALAQPSHLCMGVFFVGMATNIYSDHILRSLRKEGEKGYKIPYGGMFEYVSGANFFGEAVEWSGFAIMCGTLPAAAFALFTVCNIGPRAYQHHRWYLEKFEDYPKNRKAIIPFIL